MAKSVRLPGYPVAGRDLSHGRRLSGRQIPPDLALDGMAGNSSRALQLIDASATTVGSMIDLALLYAMFLNPGPEVEPGLVLPRETDESFHSTGGPGDANSYHQQMHVRLPDHGHGFLERERESEPIAEALLIGNGNQPSFGELDFSVDPSGYGSMAFPSFFSSNHPVVPNLTCEAANYKGSGSLLEDNMALHRKLIVSDWSMMDYSSLETFYRS